MTDEQRFSRNTFDKLNHYVSVRLQQGVPLVDADWNEQEDIRKYELQAFLKWFVGNGVPAGNDGFRIRLIQQLVLQPSGQWESIVIDLENSTAAPILGFDQQNSRPPSTGSEISLIGHPRSLFRFEGHMSLKIIVYAGNDDEEENIFFEDEDLTAEEIVDRINGGFVGRAVSSLKVVPNDFVIQGGDGTTDGAGRCLVEGLDVFNEHNLNYTAQLLYLGVQDQSIPDPYKRREALADQWGIKPKDEVWASQWGFQYILQELSAPTSGTRNDTVYLDVWEREVDAEENPDLINTNIGIETCIRWKREWVVRVAPGKSKDDKDFPKHYIDSKDRVHFFYPLAELTQTSQGATIKDLRRSNLLMLSDPLSLSGGNWDLNQTEGDLKIGNNAYRLKIGVDTGGAGAGDVRIRAQGGTNRLMLGSGTSDVLTIDSDKKVTISGGNWDLNQTEGDLKIGSNYHCLKIGVKTEGTDAGDVRIRGTNRLMLGSGSAVELTIESDKVAILRKIETITGTLSCQLNTKADSNGDFQIYTTPVNPNNTQPHIPSLSLGYETSNTVKSILKIERKSRWQLSQAEAVVKISFADVEVNDGTVKARNIQNGSSREFKDNISDLSNEEAIVTLKGLNPVKFNYKNECPSNFHIGFIAEDVPDLLASPDRKSIGPLDVVAVLTKVIKDQQQKIAVLIEKVRLLENSSDKVP
jgi:hypothetical protein